MDYPKVRKDLQSAESIVDGQTVYTLKDPKSGTFFRVRAPEYWIISQLDGDHSPEEIAAQFAGKFGAAISPEAIGKFVDHLGSLAFLETDIAEQRVDEIHQLQSAKRSIVSRILYIRIAGVNPGKVLEPLVRFYRPFHNAFWFALASLVTIVGHWVLFANRSSFSFDFAGLATVNSIGMVLLSLFILVTIHEFSHAVTCRYYGGEVRDMGFMLMYFQPCFYADLSDAWMFPKKTQRLAVTWAGPFAQFVLTAVAALIWRITVPNTFANHLAAAVATISWITILFNFNPLIKLDGYYLLSDWLEIPNLRKKSFAYFEYLFQRRILGWPVEKPETTKREQTIFLLYALGGILFSGALIVIFSVTVVKYVRIHFGGFGLGLLLLIILYTLQSVFRALGRGILRHLAYMKSLAKSPFRLIRTVVVAGVVFVIAVAIPFTHHVSGEVIVHPIAKFELILNEYGLLESKVTYGGATRETKSTYLQTTVDEMTRLDLLPLVKDGERVSAGDTIAALTSSHVNKEIEQAALELQRLQDQLALLKSPPKKEAIAEAEAEVSAAKVARDQAEREAKRLKGLFDKGLTTAEQMEAADAAKNVAIAEVTNKESRLRLLKAPPKPEEEAVIRSQIGMQESKLNFLKIQASSQSFTTPIAGTVTTYPTNGSIISVSDVEQVEIQIPVSDFDIALIDTGQEVRVKVRSDPGHLFSGRVVHIPKSAIDLDGESRFMVTVLLDNTDGLIRSGVSGYAKIVVGDRSLVSLGMRKLLSFLRVEFWSLW